MSKNQRSEIIQSRRSSSRREEERGRTHALFAFVGPSTTLFTTAVEVVCRCWKTFPSMGAIVDLRARAPGAAATVWRERMVKRTVARRRKRRIVSFECCWRLGSWVRGRWWFGSRRGRELWTDGKEGSVCVDAISLSWPALHWNLGGAEERDLSLSFSLPSAEDLIKPSIVHAVNNRWTAWTSDGPRLVVWTLKSGQRRRALERNERFSVSVPSLVNKQW